MLETLVSIVNFIKTTFYYGLYFSYKTGYILVSTINTTFKYILLCLEKLASFLSVLYESLGIFIQDILQFFQQIFILASTTVEIIYTSVIAIFLKISLFMSSIIAVISSIYNAIINGITTVITSIGHTFVFLKQLVILFGSGVWFLITLVPFLLYYLCVLCVSFINSIYQELCDMCYSGVSNVKMLVKDMVLFVLDVPIESLAGIIIALSLVYILKQFYILIMSYFKQQLRKFRNWFRRQRIAVTETVFLYFRLFSRQRIRETHVRAPRARQPVRQQVIPAQQRIQPRIPVRNQQEAQHSRENLMLGDDKCCVICQERSKCILLLPCRHLCLCVECTNELTYYNEVCPICRTNIESTMKIFV